MTPEEIDQAVAKGIITPGQALELKAEASRKDPGVEEEPFAFVDNFGAVFVVVGLVILQGAPWLFSTVLDGLAVPLLFGGFATIYWFLAEGFVRGKRRLPATASTLLFVYDGAIAGQMSIGQLLGAANGISQFATADTGFLALVALLLAIALVRFRLPLLVLGLALSIVALAMSLLNAPTLWIMGGCGLTAILIGIALDLKDPTRTGAWHEWAMWLFVVGSPLAVHPLFVTLIRDQLEDRGIGEVFDGGGTIALVIGLALIVSFVGLLLDRRSLVTSCLIYLAAAFAYLLFRTVGDPVSLLGIIPLMIGGYVILLGVAWKPVRSMVLNALPGQEILRHLPRY
ncbi:MAG: hypothetical protein ACR2RF_07525 [Geminicoccaceae bacterium]